MSQKMERRLTFAVYDSLSELKKFGTSKHEARETYNQGIHKKARENGLSAEQISQLPYYSSPYIHSYNTYYQYLGICSNYAKWLAKTHPDVQKLAYAFRKGYAREYIQQMIDINLAPSTIARSTAALAKLYRCHASDIHNNRPERRYSDFTRSRNYDEHQYIKDVEKYGWVAELCRMTGVREVELEHLYPECFTEQSDGSFILHLDGGQQHTKGKKTRDVIILKKHQNRLREILQNLEPGKLICSEAPSHLDIHGIRSMYAMDYYESIARNPDDILKQERVLLKHPKKDKHTGKSRIDAPAVYERRSDGQKFDRRALLTVSQSIGHNRVDVMVHSYLR